MDAELISKKELLELTGISYGQLYRWKRKNLLPEEWFIRKSTFTGQETFFPKDKILARLDQIMGMKEDLSLDELADMLSPRAVERFITREELLSRGIVSTNLFTYYADLIGDHTAYPFEKVLYAFILGTLLERGDVNLDEGRELLQVLIEHYPKLEGKDGEILLLRKMGVSFFALRAFPGEVYWDARVRVVLRLSLAACVQDVKWKLSRSEGLP